ncbi:MAG: resuscitation-promoting factor RpfB [Actinomycetota bacterium]|nr:resuscitation-promoting factor RpfB [Actinomycetota bacterium]
MSVRHNAPHDLPAIGSPEHTALLSGSLDLGEIMDDKREPLVGFTPIVLDPRGPHSDEPTGKSSRVFPSRRSRRGGLPVPRSGGVNGRPRQLPLPPVVAGRRTGALGCDGANDTLIGMSGVDDLMRTGELARPFVSESSLAKWVTSDDPPPPVSVDVFQRAVRAGLAPEQAAGLLTEAKPGPGSRSRTRRELRNRERVGGSTAGLAARRLAKGGILVVTALGVVSSINPQALGALGLDDDKVRPSDGLGFAHAITPKVEAPPVTPQGELARKLVQRERLLRQEIADQRKDSAFAASTAAGSAIRDLAFQQDAAMDARRKAELARVTREVARNPRAYAASLIEEQGWDKSQFQCLNQLWTRESQWNYRAVNQSSGAYGIAQALPGNKMSSFGSDWRTNPITQMKWGLNYIEGRYGTPCGAWAHSESVGWY